MKYGKMAALKNPAAFEEYCKAHGIALPFDGTVETGAGPLAQPCVSRGRSVGNRFCVLPMEGWDCLPDGKPSDLTRRRWERFGESGAKLVWGGEAAAVQPDGKSNPGQLLINEANLPEITSLREQLVKAHADRYGNTGDLLVGLQLTHSGRFSRPYEGKKTQPVIAYHHPLLDARTGVGPEHSCVSDDNIRRLIDRYVEAAVLAGKAGFDFVDVKHCHGYFGHELLTAFDRPGVFGGSFENRTRFAREIISGIGAACRNVEVGVRLSLFDFVPFQKSPDGIGVPVVGGPYKYAFGGDGTGQGIDLTETIAFCRMLGALGVRMICTTAGSPYYNPHIQRPAMFPPSDGYLPPEDPLAGVARQIHAVAKMKEQVPDMLFVGCAYSYLQEWLPNVAQAVVRKGMADFIGLGRMILPYPDMPADILQGNPLKNNRICRTFSDCTTAPRNGMVSGCYPLDSHYKSMPEYSRLSGLKARDSASKRHS
ncbi:MAG: NADH:flavin oxidoreductase [bacterium]